MEDGFSSSRGYLAAERDLFHCSRELEQASLLQNLQVAVMDTDMKPAGRENVSVTFYSTA